MNSDQTAEDSICTSLRGPSLRSGRHDLLCRQLRTIVLATLFALASCGPVSPPSEPPRASGEWREFQGQWTAVGTRHAIQLGGDRRSSTLNLSGSLLLSGPGRPNAGFRSEAVVLNDSATGMIGRAVWTDERGDQLYSELRGEGTATGNRIVGRIIGGSGRYSGATGDYEFSWKFVLEAEDGSVQGQSVGLRGKVRTGDPRAIPNEGGTRP